MIVLVGTVLAFVLFFVDILTPAGFAGGIPYVAVIILALCSSKAKHAIYFAIGTSILTILGSFLSPPDSDILNVSMNRTFGLFVIWITTIISVQYKRGQETRAYLAAIVDSSDDAIIGETLDGKIISWNNGAEQIFGYTAQEVIGQSVKILLPETSAREIPELLQLLKWGKRINYYDTVRKRKDGRQIDVSLTISPIKDSGGNLIGASTIARDITRRKEIQEEIRRERDRAQQYLDIAEVILVALNAQGQVTLINKKGLKILDYSESELIGKNWFDCCIPESTRHDALKSFRRLLAGEFKELEYFENPVVTKSGEVRLVVWHNTFIRDEAGKITGTLSSGDDVTEQRKIEQMRLLMASIVDSSDDGIIGFSMEGAITSWNRGAQQVYGYTSEEVIGKPVSILVPEHKTTEVVNIFDRLKRGEGIKNHETIRKRKDGQVINVSLTISPIIDNGKIIGVSTIVREITERIKAQKRLEQLKDQLELEKTKLEQVLSIEEGLNATLNLNKLIDFVVCKTVEVLEADKCSLMLLDEKSNELCIKGFSGLDEQSIIRSRLKIGEPIAGVVAQEGNPVLVTDIETDSRFQRQNRTAYRSKSFLCVPIKLDGDLMGVISVADKKTREGVFSKLDLKILCMITRQVAVAIETAKLYKELSYLSITDPLTNMFNYRHFAKTLDQEIKRLKRYPGDLCLLMIDVDDFKSYNDSFGHLAGDFLLKEVARILNENLRSVDIACRYAGDEFVIILPQTKIPQAEVVAEKIKQKVEEFPFKRKITLSIGVATYSNNLDRFELMLKADTALYDAKKHGKNRVCIHG